MCTRKIICVISFLICVICTQNIFAFQNKLSTTFEIGERSATDTTEDRDVSGNLDFYRYYLRFDQEISKLTKYNFSYERYYKDYETSDNLDSRSNQWHFGLDHTFQNSPLKLDLSFGFMEKDYKNSPSSEYDRSNATVGLTYKHEDLWSINWKNGFINYDYVKSGDDQLKLFTKLSGWAKFFDERLKIAPSYKFQDVDQESKDRIENIFNVSSSYKLKMPYVDKIDGSYELGRNDTKDYEEEDRDDDLRFKYTKWRIGTAHPLLEKLDTAFKYSQIRRDYQNSDNDYKTWFVENKTDFKIFEDKIKKIGFSAKAEHKEGNFHLVDSLNYIRNSITNEFSYKIKNNWELTPSFAFKKYEYSDSPTKDERQYETKIDFLKQLLDQNLELKLTYKYVWKDYKYKSDITLWSVKAGVDYKF